ncbi:glycosyltransferase family 2 protein [Halanaerobacter jeridensis]|uniref:Glycosyltransferase involved in cell wall biosynthesis n=1 Tax=Halanaerobacter jeridensis TaxID=706427 RepID=A0A939BN32_9FIRM|nr:glycosyltransferase family 2 protein [Halanaerobacter jeridensis]MBM7558080.1 glycosyltransferase involved in cell wall biosynthesis [Halanaerobacter jeridensis]
MQKKEDFLVSIITPLYNEESFISQTINSVLNQTYKNWELLVIDDCSTDNGPEIVKEFSFEENRIKLIQLEKNIGVTKARNRGIKEAEGRYVAFLDSDDLWEPEKLEKQINYMKKNNFSISFTSYKKINEDGNYRGTVEVPNRVKYADLLKTNIMGCLTVIYDRKELGKRYFKDLDKSEDYVLWLEILKEVDFAFGIQEPLASYRVMQESRSSNKISVIKQQWKIYREIEGLNLFKSFYYFLNYLYYGYKRYRI